MRELEKLGMTDHASRRRSGFFARAGLLSFLALLLYVVGRNYFYFADDLLAPNFDAIHRAYRFNLIELPWTLLGAAVFFLIVSRMRPIWRSGGLLLAGLFIFLAVDLWALRYYINQIEPERLVLREVRLETPKLTQAVRILHVTDIQAGAVSDYVEEVFDAIATVNPDIILYTGDFLQPVAPATFESEWPKLLKLFREVNPRLGTYAVFGDTEMELYRIPPEAIAPIQILSSRSVTVAVEGGALSLHGLSLFQSKDPNWAMRSVDLWLEQSSTEAFRILMGHAPDYALGMQDRLIDLCLAGHTHGGQIRLPWFGPPVIDSKVPREWARGFRRIGVPYLNVSAGAGSNRYKGLPRMRFNCPTEMTVIDLIPLRSIR